MNESLLTKLFVGTGFPLAAITISHATVNAWLQTASLCIGITVGVLTAISIIKNGFKK
jgi:hypothetical protein